MTEPELDVAPAAAGPPKLTELLTAYYAEVVKHGNYEETVEEMAEDDRKHLAEAVYNLSRIPVGDDDVTGPPREELIQFVDHLQSLVGPYIPPAPRKRVRRKW